MGPKGFTKQQMDSVPEYLDWRLAGAVTQVKDQVHNSKQSQFFDQLGDTLKNYHPIVHYEAKKSNLRIVSEFRNKDDRFILLLLFHYL